MASHTDRVNPEASTIRYGISASRMDYLNEDMGTLTRLQVFYDHEDEVSNH